MNSDTNFLTDGIPGVQNLTDEQKEAVKKKFNELKEDSDSAKAPPGHPDPTIQINEFIFRMQRNFSAIMKKYVIGTGANILYCLSVMTLIYGISGVFGPIFEKHDTLWAKLSCVSTLSLYEIALFCVLGLLMLLKKSLDDAVSIMLYVALFIVGTAIGIDSLSNDNRQVALIVGLIASIIAAAKILLMGKKMKIDFSRYMLWGMMLFFVWNFFTSPIMAYVISDDPAIKDTLRNVWLGGWLIMLGAGVAMLIGALRTPDGAELERGKGRQFVLSRGMAWVFSLFLILSGIGHQIAIGYVFEFKYSFGDFIPLIILFSLLQIEMLRIYGKKTGVLEMIVSLIPLAIIGISSANRLFIIDYSFSPGFLWNPPALMLIGGLSLVAVFLISRKGRFAWVAVPYFLCFLISIASSIRVPGITNTNLFFGVLALVVLSAGLYFRQALLVLGGYTLGVIGMSSCPQITGELAGWGLSLPSALFLIWGVGVVVFALYFAKKFPLLISVIAAFIAMAASFHVSDSGYYILASSLIFTGLAVAYWIRCGDKSVVLLLSIPLMRGAFNLLYKLEYWDFVMLSFVLLGIGAMISVFSRGGKEEEHENGPAEHPKSGFKNPSTVEIAVLIFIMSLVAFGLAPSLKCGREKSRTISCTSNLKQIGLAIRMYSQENKECFPPYDGAKGLEMLRSGGYLENVRMYTCPSTTDTIPDNNEITDKNCSYDYRGGLTESSSVDIAVVWDKPKNHVKYGNALFTDGHAAGFAGTDWMKNTK
ncbi:MAG: hypothetical protein A2X48_06450 [Lentisphaerae bacterium GWF2_49_21]|nr:MAG: hypothetical protein A2X48_06450 [Lentisphaerae bacterium GWF2_49_21]